MNWKAVAIVFMSLFFALLIFNIWSIRLVEKLERDQLNCYYDICKDNADALFDNELCYCYDYSVMGDLVVVKTEVMK